MNAPAETSGAAESVDVLIITAADAEDEAVRLVNEGAMGPWQETPGPAGYPFAVWLRCFETPFGRPLRVALSRAYEHGSPTADAAGRLVEAYNPQCLAMCGVCAGNPARTRLGDVIIADRVYAYDVGVNLTIVSMPPTLCADY